VNWKLILQLSMFGLAMGVATALFIPSTIEPVFWLAIFIFCAYVIAKRTSRPFLHGLFLGLANCVWIIAAHVLLFDSYVSSHARELEMMQGMPSVSPRFGIVLFGIPIGVISGCVIGLFALVARRFVAPRPSPAYR